MPVRPASITPRPRAVYPYSVVPGGAWSRAELVDALERDPVAAQHYGGFRASQASLERLQRPLTAYLSYRIHNAVYWTRKAVTLPADEAVLSDGENLARARCGNRISMLAKQPVGPEVDLDTPETPPAMGQNAPAPPADGIDLPLLVHELFPPYLPGISPGGTASMALPAGSNAPGGGLSGFGGGGTAGGSPMLAHATPSNVTGPGTPAGPTYPPPSGVLTLTSGAAVPPIGSLLTGPNPAPGTGVPPGFTTSGPPLHLIGFVPAGNPPFGGMPSVGSGPPGSSGPPSVPAGGGGPPVDLTPSGDPPPTDGSPPGAPPDFPPLTPPGIPPVTDSGVPEPAPALLLAAGACVLAIRRAMR